MRTSCSMERKQSANWRHRISRGTRESSRGLGLEERHDREPSERRLRVRERFHTHAVSIHPEEDAARVDRKAIGEPESPRRAIEGSGAVGPSKLGGCLMNTRSADASGISA